MTGSNNSRLWVAVVVAVAVFATATWFNRSGSPERSGNTAPETMEPGPPASSAAMPDPLDSALRIAEHGRLRLAADALPDDGRLALVLDLPDEARGDGLRTVRIVSTDGRRIETTASPLAGAGTGVQLEIDSGFLSRGRYMIEIDTVENSHFQIRRYVLELE